MKKILIYTAILLMIGASVLGYLNYYRFRTILLAQNATIEEQRQACTDLEAELKTFKEEAGSVSEEEEKSKKETEDAKQAQEKSSSDLAQAQKQISDQEAELTQLKSDLAAKIARIQELEAAQQPAPATETSTKGKTADTKLKGTRGVPKKETAHPTPVAKEVKEVVSHSGEGKVLAVNTTWNFVVLNQGDQNGIANGTEITIQRGPQVIAKAKITSVEAATSVADIIMDSVAAGATVQVEDTVLFSPQAKVEAK